MRGKKAKGLRQVALSYCGGTHADRNYTATNVHNVTESTVVGYNGDGNPILHTDSVTACTLVLDSHCARAVYQQLKKGA